MADQKSLPNRRAPIFGGKQPADGDPASAPPESGSSHEGKPAKKKISIKLPPIPNQKWIWTGLIGSSLLFLFGFLMGFVNYLKTDSGVRNWLLPYLSKKLGVEISAEYVSFDPMSFVKFKNLKLGPEKKPFLKAKFLTVKYDGWAILKHEYKIESISLISPEVDLLEKEGGKLEGIPDFWKPQVEGFLKLEPHVDLEKIEIQKLEGTIKTAEYELLLREFDLKSKNIRSNTTLRFDIAGGFSYKKFHHGIVMLGEKNDPLEGEIQDGKALFQVDQNFRPITGNLVGLTARRFKGEFKGFSLDGLEAVLVSDFTIPNDKPMAIKEFVLTVKKNDDLLLNMNMKGSFDPITMAADFQVQTNPMQKSLLDPFLKPLQIDFRDSSASYTGRVSIPKGGESVSLEGKWLMELKRFSLPNLEIKGDKPLQVNIHQTMDLDLNKHNAKIGIIKMETSQSGRAFLRSNLIKPFRITWSDHGKTTHEPIQMDVQISPADWALFSPYMPISTNWKIDQGSMEGKGVVVLEDFGEKIAFETSLALSEAKVHTPWLELSDGTVLFDGKGKLEKLNTLELQPSSLKLREGTRSILVSTISSIGEFSTGKNVGNLKFHFSAPELLFRGVSPVDVSQGAMTGIMSWRLNSKDHFGFDLEYSATELQAKFKGKDLKQVNLKGKLKLDWDAPVLKINSPQGNLSMGKNANLDFKGEGEWNRDSDDLSIQYSLAGLNPSLLSPWIPSSFPVSDYQSGTLASRGIFQATKDICHWNSTNEIENLDFTSKINPRPTKPLHSTLVSDLRWSTNGVFQIQSMNLTLDSVPQSKNIMNFQGVVERKPDFIYANVDVSGSSVDLTQWNDQWFPVIMKMTDQGKLLPWKNSDEGKDLDYDFRVHAKLNGLRIHDLSVTDLDLPLHFTKDAYELVNARLRYKGAPTLFTVTSNQKDLSQKYRFSGKLEGLSLKSAEGLIPGIHESVGGILSLKTYGEGRGRDLDSFWKNLNAVFEGLTIKKARLENIPWLGETLKRLSEILRVPSLSTANFSEAESNLEYNRSNQSYQNLRINSSNLKLYLKGEIQKNGRLNMEGVIDLRRDILNQSILSPYSTMIRNQRGDWITLPEKIRIEGTLDRPRIRFNPNNILDKLQSVVPFPAQNDSSSLGNSRYP